MLHRSFQNWYARWIGGMCSMSLVVAKSHRSYRSWVWNSQEHTRSLEQDMQKQSEWFSWRWGIPAGSLVLLVLTCWDPKGTLFRHFLKFDRAREDCMVGMGHHRGKAKFCPSAVVVLRTLGWEMTWNNSRSLGEWLCTWSLWKWETSFILKCIAVSERDQPGEFLVSWQHSLIWNDWEPFRHLRYSYILRLLKKG